MNIYQSLRHLVQVQQFQPGLLGMFVNPFYFARKGLNEAIKSIAPQLQGSLLDVGCGRKPYKIHFTTSQYIGLEFSNGKMVEDEVADVYYDGEHFPFNHHVFDSVFASQVFEHVFNPDLFMAEINRILRIDGKLLITVPFLWGEHMQPYDFARYTSFGLTSVLKENGFEIVQQIKSMNDVRALFQLFNAYLYQKTVTRSGISNLLVCMLLMAPVTLVGKILALILPSNDELYLDNIILAKKMADV